MNRESLYKADDDDGDNDDDDIREDLEDLRRACMVSEANFASGGGVPSDSEDEDDFEMLRSIKSQLSPSTDVDLCGTPPIVPSGSESEDDFEMLRSIKSQLALPMDEDEDEDEDGAFETLGAIRRRFSAYENFGKKKQVHASDNSSRSKTFESFLDHQPVQDSKEVEAVDLHEKTFIVKCQSSLMPAARSRFPETAQAFVDAIRSNRSYQGFLRRKLTEIEATIEQNEKHRKNVMIVKDFQAACKRITKQALSQKKDPPHLQLISTRKSDGNGPPENPCVANYRMALEKYPISVDRRKWTTKEKENLAKGLKQQVQDTILREAVERSSDLEGSTDDLNTVLEAVKNLEITPEMIRQFLPKVNWDQLAIKNRTAAECEARWMNWEDPLINKSPWTVAEDNNIRSMIQNNKSDWLNIAVTLGTNRTPFQCLARYQRSLNPDILNRDWTAQEDYQLRAAVDLFGEKNWQAVANSLQARTGPQCSNRWKKTLHPSREKVGRWSSEEDKRLNIAVIFFGADKEKWRNIAKFVPGRTNVQCRERWVNIFKPKVNHGKWTEEEDAKLREAIREHGHCWSKVALHMSSCRTDNQCLRRWKSLNPHLVALKQETRKLQRESTVGNFVDRESERPARVASDDFLALIEISLEPEQQLTQKKKKRKAKQKKSDSAATEREPKKRRRKRLERSSGEIYVVDERMRLSWVSE